MVLTSVSQQKNTAVILCIACQSIPYYYTFVSSLWDPEKWRKKSNQTRFFWSISIFLCITPPLFPPPPPPSFGRTRNERISLLTYIYIVEIHNRLFGFLNWQKEYFSFKLLFSFNIYTIVKLLERHVEPHFHSAKM